MKKWITLLILCLSLSSFTLDIDLNDIYETIVKVESNGNPNAIGDDGMAYGIVQIHKICVDDVNKVYGTSYIHEQMFEEACAEEIFSLYLQYGRKLFRKKYGREANEEEIVRMWNGGIYKGYRKVATIKYYNRYKELKVK